MVYYQLHAADHIENIPSVFFSKRKHYLNSMIRQCAINQAMTSLHMIQRMLTSALPIDAEENKATLEIIKKMVEFKSILNEFQVGLVGLFLEYSKDAKPLVTAAVLRRASEVCSDLHDEARQVVATFKNLPNRNAFLSEVEEFSALLLSDLTLAASAIQEDASQCSLLGADESARTAEMALVEAGAVMAEKYKVLAGSNFFLGWTEEELTSAKESAASADKPSENTADADVETAKAHADAQAQWIAAAKIVDEGFDIDAQRKSVEIQVFSSRAQAGKIRTALKEAPLDQVPSRNSLTERVNLLTTALNAKAREVQAARNAVQSSLGEMPSTSPTAEMSDLSDRLTATRDAHDENLATLKNEVDRLKNHHHYLQLVRTVKRFLFKDLVLTQEFVEPLTKAKWMTVKPPQGARKEDSHGYLETRSARLHLSREALEDLGGEQVLLDAPCFKNANALDIVDGKNGGKTVKLDDHAHFPEASGGKPTAMHTKLWHQRFDPDYDAAGNEVFRGKIFPYVMEDTLFASAQARFRRNKDTNGLITATWLLVG